MMITIIVADYMKRITLFGLFGYFCLERKYLSTLVNDIILPKGVQIAMS